MTYWTQEEDVILEDLIRRGIAYKDMPPYFSGRTGKACRHRAKVLNIDKSTKKKDDPRPPVEDFKKAAAKGRVEITSEWDDPYDPHAAWQEAESESVFHIGKAKKIGRFHIRVPGDKPIAVAFISDQHIAPGTPVDFKQMRLDAEAIRDTEGFYAILGGDGVDNHIKHRSAILSARSQPDDQWRLYDYYLQIFGEKLLVMIAGNHDLWTNEWAGTDMTKHLAERNKACYAPEEARITMQVGSQEYKVAVRHQYRFNSQLNQLHCVKRWYDMGSEIFDIGCIGHHHEAAIEHFLRHSEWRWACRPGAYQITSAYSRRGGYSLSVPRCPTFVLHPDSKHIDGFSCLHTALRAWKGVGA